MNEVSEPNNLKELLFKPFSGKVNTFKVIHYSQIELSYLSEIREGSAISHIFHRTVSYCTINQTVYIKMGKCGATVLIYIRPPAAQYAHCPCNN